MKEISCRCNHKLGTFECPEGGFSIQCPSCQEWSFIHKVLCLDTSAYASSLFEPPPYTQADRVYSIPLGLTPHDTVETLTDVFIRFCDDKLGHAYVQAEKDRKEVQKLPDVVSAAAILFDAHIPLDRLLKSSDKQYIIGRGWLLEASQSDLFNEEDYERIPEEHSFWCSIMKAYGIRFNGPGRTWVTRKGFDEDGESVFYIVEA